MVQATTPTFSLTINSTYKIDVYTLDLPDGLTLFE